MLIAEVERLWPQLRILAIPNGGTRNLHEAVALKVSGVRPGVPDLFLPALNLWIELKREQGGRVSPEQQDWIAYLQSIGHRAHVARGHREALMWIERYLKP